MLEFFLPMKHLGAADVSGGRLQETSPPLSPSRSSGPDRRFVCGSAENRADLLPGSQRAAESKAETSQGRPCGTSLWDVPTCSWVLEVQRSRTQTAGQSQSSTSTNTDVEEDKRSPEFLLGEDRGWTDLTSRSRLIWTRLADSGCRGHEDIWARFSCQRLK